MLILFIFLAILKILHTDNIDESIYHVGCFYDVLSSTATVAATRLECFQYCLLHTNSNLIGVKDGNNCLCIDRTEKRVTSKLCNIKCPGESVYCGGSKYTSVYWVREPVTHELCHLRDYMSMYTYGRGNCRSLGEKHTITTCIRVCFEMSQPITVVTSNKCCCYGHKSTSCLDYIEEPICDRSCPGREDTFCGGTRCVRVYLTFEQLVFGMDRTAVNHCLSQETVLQTSCGESCQIGWSGAGCDIRDCKLYNGNCGSEMRCSRTVFNEVALAECVCSSVQYANASGNCFPLEASTNLAYWRPTHFSKNLNFASGHAAVDGFRVHTNNIFFRDNCQAWFAVQLKDVFIAMRVHLFTPWDSTPRINKGLDDFQVWLNLTLNEDPLFEGDMPNVTPCSTTVREKTVGLCPGTPSLVRCNEESIGKYVFLTQSKSSCSYLEFGFSEIEIYGKPAREIEHHYVGCFESFLWSQKYRVQSLNDCHQLCNNESLLYAIRNGRSCRCSNTVDYKLPSDECNIGCNDSKEYSCGSPTLYSVYSYKISNENMFGYVGCFRETQVKKIFLKGIIVDAEKPFNSCLIICRERGAEQFGIKQAKACACGQLSVKQDLLPTDQCKVKCADAPTLMCGGKGTYSVYEMESYYQFPFDSIKYHFSVREKNSMFSTQGCEDGWKGDLCDVRDCSVDNGGCGKILKCTESLIVECQHPGSNMALLINGSFISRARPEGDPSIVLSSKRRKNNGTAKGRIFRPENFVR